MTINKHLIGGLIVGALAMYGFLFTSNSLAVAKMNGMIEAISKLAPNCIAPFQQEPQAGPAERK